MEKNIAKKSSLKFIEFIIAELNIVRSPEYDLNGKLDLSIVPSGIYVEAEGTYQLTLELKVSDDKKGFSIEAKAIGFFKIKKGEDEEVLNNYFYTNAPAIIFPYVRSYISAITALSNLETVNLPIMNLTNLKSTLKENTIRIEG